MAWCLIKEKANEFRRALKDGRVDPFKLAKMTSQERHVFLGKFVGEENAKQVNAFFESKLLLKNQKAGYISWAKRVAGITPEVRKDLMARIERLDRVLSPKEEETFLNDLVNTRLGIDVTEQEAKNIFELSQKAKDLRAKVDKDFKFPSEKDRLDYGWVQVNLEKYVNELKLQAQKVSFREQPLRKILEITKEVPGFLKSTVASFDNSFFGRQGIKTLWDIRTSHIWIKNFLKSWVDIGRELAGKDAMDIIRADIYSRPNHLNGKYRVGGYQLNVLSEEAFPSHVLAKIPILKRLYLASESAYNGGALRMRADLADRFIALAEKHGVNTLDRTQAEGIGHLVGSLTGRGELPLGLTQTRRQAEITNVVFFSIKFLASNFNTLTAHLLDPKANAFVKKEAAKNLLSIVATLGSVLTIAKMIDFNSIDEDPRSTNFGRVKIFGHWTDLTGGVGALVTLASRTLVPSYHNGELGLWSKSSSGKYTNLLEQGYGKRTPVDVLFDFFQGRLSPVAGLVRDFFKQRTFDGDPFTLKTALENLKPMSIQDLEKLLKDPDSSSILGSMILTGLGFSVSTYSVTNENWETKTSKEMQQFKQKVGQIKFKEANERFNQLYYEWFKKTGKTEQYKNLSEEAKSDLISKGKEAIKEKVFKSYNFKYKEEKKTSTKKQEESIIKRLLP